MATTYIKKKSQKQEKRTAKEFKGRTTPASGALSGAKGDVRTGQREGSAFSQEHFLIENKFTDKDYYKLDLKIWDKIAGEALRDNFRTPLMQIDIQDYQIVIMDKNDLVSRVDMDDFEVIEMMSTDKKSIRLYKDDIKERLSHSHGVYLDFMSKSSLKSLVVVEKRLFLEGIL